ncbi:MAG TPA: hypothetical protein VGE07_19760 [Herpetosiphonaceae bacterium]
MIDKIFVPPSVHVATGMIVLALSLLAALRVAWLTWRGAALTRDAHGLLIGTQLALMLQALIGIKLLDQGLGAAQLFIHYVGGLAPLFFFSLLYWLPLRQPRHKTRLAAAATAGAFVFALMTFTIGQAYVRGTI